MKIIVSRPLERKTPSLHTSVFEHSKIMQLQIPDLQKELGSPLSLPKLAISRSSSRGSSSNWSLASVPYRSPDSSWEADSGDADWDDESNERGRGEGEKDVPEKMTSPQYEELVIEIADTTDDESSVSLKSSPSSPLSHIPKNGSEFTPGEKFRQDQPSSPRVYRMVSERSKLSRLGFQYRYGCGPFPQNLFKSSKFYTEASELGCSDALAALAVACIFGIGVPCSLDEARPMLRKALLKGSIDALEVRALCFMTGIFDGKRNYSSCLELLTMGVARNSAACLLWAGFCFEVGLGTNPDPYAAKQAYLAAGESSTMTNLMLQMLPGAKTSNDPWALMKISLFLLHSSGDPSQRDHAMDCLKKAALLGFPDAQLYLAICLIQGKWLQKSTSAALYWLQQENQEERHPVAQRVLRQLDGLRKA